MCLLLKFFWSEFRSEKKTSPEFFKKMFLEFWLLINFTMAKTEL